MKKYIHILMPLLAITICVALSGAVFADFADGPEFEFGTIPGERLLPRVSDYAGLLDQYEEETLEETLDEISERQGVDVAVLTINDLPDGYDSIVEYADDVYDYCGFGFGEERDGCMLVISMAERDWYISTCGYGITALTDFGIEYIGDQMIDSGLSDGYYYSAFDCYARLCDDFITYAREGQPFNRDSISYETNWGMIAFLSLIVAVIAGFAGSGIMLSKMKTVRFQKSAANYVKKDSMKLNVSRDTYLYSSVARTVIETESSSGSSTHTSSSGTTHGGGGGKF